MSPIEERLRKIARVQAGEPLARHTTFRIGGPADFLVHAGSTAELAGVLAVAREHGLPLWMLGNGSNLLVGDGGVRGLVLVLTGELATRRLEGARVIAGAGYDLPKLAVEVSRLGLGGLSFACGIPGTVGAGLVINAGAHGSDMSGAVEYADVMYPDGRVARLGPAEIGFGYRTSRLQGTGAIVTAVTFALQPADPGALAADVRRYLEHRRNTQPLLQPNAGSIFKNPPGQYAGRLIEAAGCKGWQEGGAQVSEKHANFIVNLGDATAAHVLTLMRRVRSRVLDTSGIHLAPEIRIWGAEL